MTFDEGWDQIHGAAEAKTLTKEGLVEEIRSRFKNAQASLVVLRGTESYAAGYGLGYHDAIGEILEYITDRDLTSSIREQEI